MKKKMQVFIYEHILTIRVWKKAPLMFRPAYILPFIRVHQSNVPDSLFALSAILHFVT